MRTIPTATLVLLAATAIHTQAAAQALRRGLDPGLQCRAAIRTAERAAGIPAHLMAAIGRVESGRRGPDGEVHPWPWSINAEGTDYVYETKSAVLAAVRALQAKGVRSIDVGCMQVNLMHHPQAFATLEQAFDPIENARYAARFLVELKAQTGAWEKATAYYHSATPELGAPYQRKVMAVWPEEKRHGPEAVREELAAAWGATLGPQHKPSVDGFGMQRRLEAARQPQLRQARRGADVDRLTPIPIAARSSGHIPM